MKLSEQIRKSMDDAEDGLAISWPIDQWADEVAQLEADVTTLENEVIRLEDKNDALIKHAWQIEAQASDIKIREESE